MQKSFCFFCLLLFLGTQGWANGWQANLAPRPALPDFFFAVDKNKQETFLLRAEEQGNAFSPAMHMICSTGQHDGDKAREGDSRTPEGIYFIEEKKTDDLYYLLYGNTAYPLNYPNPIDRLHGKTGSGIWMHGRGTPLTPKMTRGCVSLPNNIIDNLDTFIELHKTPVCIAQHLNWQHSPTNLRAVLQKTWSWICARESQETRRFALYDQIRFAQAMKRPFADYQQDELALQKKHSWWDMRTGPIHILEGPGYAVSFFTELTIGHGYAQQGWRRLYWMPDAQQSWQIVGEEWVAQDLDLDTDYTKQIAQELGAGFPAVFHLQQNSDLDRQQGTATWQTSPKIRLTKRGVEVYPTEEPQKGPWLFRPGKFNTWQRVQ